MNLYGECKNATEIMTANVLSHFNTIVHDPAKQNYHITDEEIEKARRFVKKEYISNKLHNDFYDNKVKLYSNIQIAEHISKCDFDFIRVEIISSILDKIDSVFKSDDNHFNYNPNDWTIDIYWTYEDTNHFYLYLKSNYINSDGKYNIKYGKLTFDDGLISKLSDNGWDFLGIEHCKSDDIDIKINANVNI